MLSYRKTDAYCIKRYLASCIIAYVCGSCWNNLINESPPRQVRKGRRLSIKVCRCLCLNSPCPFLHWLPELETFENIGPSSRGSLLKATKNTTSRNTSKNGSRKLISFLPSLFIFLSSPIRSGNQFCNGGPPGRLLMRFYF